MKRILSILILSLTANFVFAQSMSDDQVIRYVQERMEKGESQEKIVQSLFSKGVTAQQMRRVRKKYQAQQEQLGAVNVTTKNDNSSRLRNQRQREGESQQQRENYMIQGNWRGNKGNQGYSNAEQRQMLSQEMNFLDIDSLVYYRNLLEDKNQVFGRNIFNNQYLTFAPSANMATPANYRLGAGDAVIIDVWGSAQETFEQTVSPDGTVVIEGIGPVKLAGLTVQAATKRLQSSIGRRYAGCQVSLSLGETRSIQVQVVGEVNVPGTYTLSSLSSAFNALYAAGGISNIGTLRNIKVYRAGREIATVDVYDYLLNGNGEGDVHLQDNDVIVVGAYEALVNVRGKVKRPMFYEMKTSESVATLIDYAGGFTGDAYKKNVRLVRKSGNEYSIHTIDEFEMKNFNLSDADSIYVDSVTPRFSNMVELRGAVYHSGMFEIGSTISTVRELIQAADGVRADAFMNRAVMHREKEDKTLEVVSLDLQGILNGTIPDVPLRKNDVIYVPNRLDMLGEQILKISGEVVYPGTYAYADNTSIEDLVLQAGGLTEAASLSKVDVYRRINRPTALERDNNITETYTFSIKDGFVVDGQQGFTLQPYDEVVVRRSPTYFEQQNVTIEGNVNFPGQYSMTNKKYRLSDLVKAAGGLSSLAYARGARLERRMTEEERLQQEVSLRANQIALYEESLQSENKNFDLNRADTVLQMKMDLGTTYSVSINLESALADTASFDNMTLRDGDRLIVPKYSNTVKVSGDVMYPNSMNYREGKSLNYYIKRAGGYGNNARKSRVYAIYMNGSVELINHRSNKAIQPGCEIVVPSKKTRNEMTTAETMSIGTSATSIATMIITVANILK